MMALSSLSLVAAAVVAFRNPKPSGPENGRAKPSLAGVATPRPLSPSGASIAPDLTDLDAWMDDGDAPPTYHARAAGAPTEAVEVDDDFGAALQPAGRSSLIEEAVSLLRIIGRAIG